MKIVLLPSSTVMLNLLVEGRTHYSQLQPLLPSHILLCFLRNDGPFFVVCQLQYLGF